MGLSGVPTGPIVGPSKKLACREPVAYSHLAMRVITWSQYETINDDLDPPHYDLCSAPLRANLH